MCVCSFLLSLLTEYQTTHSTMKVRTFSWSSQLQRPVGGFRLRVGSGVGGVGREGLFRVKSWVLCYTSESPHKDGRIWLCVLFSAVFLNLCVWTGVGDVGVSARRGSSRPLLRLCVSFEARECALT